MAQDIYSAAILGGLWVRLGTS